MKKVGSGREGRELRGSDGQHDPKGQFGMAEELRPPCKGGMGLKPADREPLQDTERRMTMCVV